MKTVPRAVVWTILMLMAFVLVMVGFSKFAGQSSSRWAARFAHWGYPVVLSYVVGALEIISGIGLLVPVATRPAAGAIMAVMAGALCTHLSHGEVSRVGPPLVLGTFAFLIFLWRHPLQHNKTVKIERTKSQTT